MSAQAHYNSLFASAAREFGAASDMTLTGIIGFSGGGPVSICRLGTGAVYVTCELSLTPDQKESSEGMKFEFLSRLPLSEHDTQNFLTGLGALSLDEELGDMHTIDVSAVSPAPNIRLIRLQLHSSCSINGAQYGIYEVCDATAA
jgi:hypothetical protein